MEKSNRRKFIDQQWCWCLHLKKVDIEKLCNESPETDDAIVDDEGGVVKFNNKFSCLGSAINFVLDDTVDA